MSNLPDKPIMNSTDLRNNGTFRWDDNKDKILLREVRMVEPYRWKTGSKEAGHAWTEVATLVNTYEGFKSMTRDQRSVRERFNKIMGDHRSKMRAEINASGINPDPLTEIESLLEEIAEIMLNIVIVPAEKNKDQKEERAKALSVRDAAMNTWSKTQDGNEKSVDGADIEKSTGDKQSTRKRKRRSSADPIEYLKIKSEESMAIQKEEMELHKQHAIIEQQRLVVKEKEQQQKEQQLMLQQQKMNQFLESQQNQFKLQQQQMQMQVQMQMQSQAAMMAILEKLTK